MEPEVNDQENLRPEWNQWQPLVKFQGYLPAEMTLWFQFEPKFYQITLKIQMNIFTPPV